MDTASEFETETEVCHGCDGLGGFSDGSVCEECEGTGFADYFIEAVNA